MTNREEIAELLANYAWAMDAGDFGGMVEIFAEDATFSIEIPGTDTIGPFSPRPAVIEFIASAGAELDDQRRHVVTNQRFVREGEDEAEVTATLTLNATADGKLTVVATGVYEVTARRQDGSWRIASLRILLDAPFS